MSKTTKPAIPMGCCFTWTNTRIIITYWKRSVLGSCCTRPNPLSWPWSAVFWVPLLPFRFPSVNQHSLRDSEQRGKHVHIHQTSRKLHVLNSVLGAYWLRFDITLSLARSVTIEWLPKCWLASDGCSLAYLSARVGRVEGCILQQSTRRTRGTWNSCVVLI